MKYLFPFILSLSLAGYSFSQTLFTYGKYAVSKDEFIKAFNKNPSTETNRQKALDDYLQLYIKFKLKVQAAKEANLQADENFKLEADNFKRQVADNFINEQANIDKLVKEAFLRSQQDIQLAQVFIEVAPNTDTTKAFQAIQKAYAELKAGKSFDEVTANYSTDAAAKYNKGVMGYVTVFSLPYTIENIIYHLSPGQYAAPYKSSIGYHIFKVNSVRPAVGKRKIQQVLIPFPGNAGEPERQAAEHKADSLYAAIQAGVPFEQVAQQNNTNSSSSNGVLSDVGVGQYSEDFEQQIFSLKKPGEVSKPFTTSYGYHIIKLLEINAVSKDTSDIVTKGMLQQQVQRDDRLTIAKQRLVYDWLKVTQFKHATFDENNLWKYTDSILHNRDAKSVTGITPQTTLFSFAKQTFKVKDWIQYAGTNTAGNPLFAARKYKEAFADFIKTSCDQYYREHIEDYSSSIKDQLKEFNDANLLFAVMDKQVWGKASNDTAGLKKYYEAHKTAYTWQPSVSALFITTTGKEQAEEVATKIKANPQQWRGIAESLGTQVYSDSSRYENDQLPVRKVRIEKGYMSQPEKNENDNNWSFLYITDVFPSKEQRSFEDARGMVINDYQQVVEERWIEDLKKKYPLKINEGVFKTIK